MVIGEMKCVCVKMCDNRQGNVNVMQKVYSLMERCDGHGEV